MSNRTQNHVPAVDTTTSGRLPYTGQTDGAREHTEHANEQQGKARAAGLYAATVAYDAALSQPNPSATLDDMADGVAAIVPVVCKALGVDANTEFAEALGTSITDRLWAFNAIEFARAECGDGYGYVFDLLANGVRNGGDPHIARQTALDVPKRLRQNAEAAR